MRYNRRKALTILGAVTAATVLTQADPSRGVSTATLGFFYAPDENGHIWATSYSESPGVRAKARVLTAKAGTLIGEVTDFTVQRFAPDPNGKVGVRFLSRDPLLLPELGNFWIEWEVETEDGGGGKGAVDFRYWRIPVITIEATPTVVDSRHRTVSVTGKATWLHPGTRAERPLTNYPITLWVSQPNVDSLLLTTDDDGKFSAEVALSYGTNLIAYTWDDWQRFGMQSASNSISVTHVNTPTRISLAANPASVVAGKQVIVSGVLEQFLDDAWFALPGYEIRINLQPNDATATSGWLDTTLITDQAGRFSTSFVPELIAVVGGATFNLDGSAGYRYFNSCISNYIVVRVLRNFAFKGAPVAQRKNGNPHSSIWNAAVYVDPTMPAADERTVEFQISEDGKTGWKTLASTKTPNHTVYASSSTPKSRSKVEASSGPSQHRTSTRWPRRAR